MHSYRRTFGLLIAAVSLTAVTCNKGGGPADAPPAPEAAASSAPAAPAPTPPAPAAEDPRRTLADLPGMNFSTLSPAAQKELAAVFSDEFCYCGCPHTIGQCLKAHGTCKHAKRMAKLAAPEAQAGASSQEIIVSLQQYYQSFREPRRTPKVDDRMCRGPKDAKVTLVEYSDFECPYCGQARPVLEKLVKDRSDTRLCYAPFPLQMHPNAIPAGQAALFARDHGKFWEMHDALFENQTQLTPGFIQQLATRIGLDAAALSKAMQDKKYVDELESWRESGRSAGVDSTPSVYFNGRKLTLTPTADHLAHSVDDELEWTANKNAWAAD